VGGAGLETILFSDDEDDKEEVDEKSPRGGGE